jgi:hypothetical protein
MYTIIYPKISNAAKQKIKPHSNIEFSAVISMPKVKRKTAMNYKDQARRRRRNHFKYDEKLGTTALLNDPPSGSGGDSSAIQ